MKNTQTTVNKATLYIGTHNETGLKYFGKTKKYHTQEDLQKYYHGSGVYWSKHLKKHGDDVTMELYGVYNLDEVKEMALKLSEEWNIVKSKEWANIIPENGLDGGGSKSSAIKSALTMSVPQEDGVSIREKASKSQQETNIVRYGGKAPACD